GVRVGHPSCSLFIQELQVSKTVSRTVSQMGRSHWMKPLIAGLVGVFVAVPLSAQGGAKKADGKMEGMEHSKMGMQEPATGWKELDAFHTILAATWHPVSGKNDFAPIKAKAGDLATAAHKWAASTAPKGCDTPKIKSAMTDVAAGSQRVALLVDKNTDDASIKKELGAVHEKFEVVEMSCKPRKDVAK
ncbi:MAG: hypothetical protein ABJB66_13235, partial [Gemmatimonadaceae bacterium]